MENKNSKCKFCFKVFEGDTDWCSETCKNLDLLSDKTGRSRHQTLFLYDLVDRDFEKLKQLEVHMKNSFYFWCPGTKEEVEKVFKREKRTNSFEL